MIVFLVAFFAVIDASLILYHQLALSQSTKRTARRAGTNLYDRTDIDRHFWVSLPPTLIQSTAAGGTASITITTNTIDANFASTVAPGGQPSVLVEATYDHSLIGGLGFVPTITLEASAVAQITTWDFRPDVEF
jgi:hypothetical protein